MKVWLHFAFSSAPRYQPNLLSAISVCQVLSESISNSSALPMLREFLDALASLERDVRVTG